MSHYAARSSIFAVATDDAVEGVTMTLLSRDVRPGDHLPPQVCLDPTEWQDSGFTVGSDRGDVRLDFPRPGLMLLAGELGILDCLGTQALVTVIRAS